MTTWATIGRRTPSEPAELRGRRDRRPPLPTLSALLLVSALGESADARTCTSQPSFDLRVLRRASFDLAVDLGAAALWQLSREGRVLLEVIPPTEGLVRRPAMIGVHLRRPGIGPGLAGDLLRTLERTGSANMPQLLGRWRNGEGRKALPTLLIRRCADELVARGALVKKGAEFTEVPGRLASLRRVASAASALWQELQADSAGVPNSIRGDCERAVKAGQGGGG